MSCIIDTICYGEDATNPHNADEICKPEISESQWTQLIPGSTIFVR